jgi:transcriptional regulator GlxA family with amidase domain
MALLVTLVTLAAVLPSVAQQEKPLATQTVCPEMGGPINPDLYVDYQGKRIYLCCEMCREAVTKDPEGAIRKLAEKGQAAQLIPAKEAPAKAQTQKRTLGVLLFPGFELLDAYGPMELWGNLKEQVQVVTIAAKRGEIASGQGPKTVADYGYADAPQIDLLLVPGGRGTTELLQDKATLQWLQTRAQKAEIVMSVCNGASLLAAAGILDGRPATTNKMFWEMSTAPGPKVKWVKKARWVDDGNVVTSSGVSAGMDMSLAVIDRLYGKELAGWLERLTEYEPHRDPSWDPFAKTAGNRE